ncbi:MAG: hypothetical protein U9Q06_04135 [Nanoarchaeota archaeon]|nr:hypothetical protein [Nanoarchaeota archaeon]
MNFKEFIKKGIVRSTSPNIPLVKSLIKMSENDLKFLKTLKVNKLSSRKLMTDYYDILRLNLEAISIMKGYKIYSHKALTYLLKEMNEEILASKFDMFRKIRNKINYYGTNIDIEETNENIKEILQMIKFLKNKYLNNL